MNVVIVDDHPLVRAGLEAVFATERDVTVVAAVADVQAGIDVISRKRPDIALVDLRLGTDSGLEVVRRSRESVPECRYIILTSSVDRNDFLRAVAMGVDGYALKEALPEELLYAIRLVARGRKYVDPLFMDTGASSESSNPFGMLTAKELEVLKALGRGLSNREIAQELYISEYTVKKHVSQVLAKLNVADRTQAALWANAHGLVQYGKHEMTGADENG